MQLELMERLQILNSLLPQEGNAVKLRVITEAQGVLGLSSDELTEWDVKQDGDQVVWNQEKVVAKDIPISDAVRGIITEELSRLNDEDKLTMQQLSLWDKFVSPNGQAD